MRIISEIGEKFGRHICRAISTKYNRRLSNNQIEGYGKVFLG